MVYHHFNTLNIDGAIYLAHNMHTHINTYTRLYKIDDIELETSDL